MGHMIESCVLTAKTDEYDLLLAKSSRNAEPVFCEEVLEEPEQKSKGRPLGPLVRQFYCGKDGGDTMSSVIRIITYNYIYNIIHMNMLQNRYSRFIILIIMALAPHPYDTLLSRPGNPFEHLPLPFFA